MLLGVWVTALGGPALGLTMPGRRVRVCQAGGKAWAFPRGGWGRNRPVLCRAFFQRSKPSRPGFWRPGPNPNPNPNPSDAGPVVPHDSVPHAVPESALSAAEAAANASALRTLQGLPYRLVLPPLSLPPSLVLVSPRAARTCLWGGVGGGLLGGWAGTGRGTEMGMEIGLPRVSLAVSGFLWPQRAD